MNRIVGKQY